MKQPRMNPVCGGSIFQASQASKLDALYTQRIAAPISTQNTRNCNLGVVTVVGGQYYGWNTSLRYGFFGYYLLTQLLVALAFLLYALCIAEITSAVPFSGGAYGLARVAQGFYMGFLVGCSEALECCCSVSYRPAATLYSVFTISQAPFYTDILPSLLYISQCHISSVE